MKRPWENEPVGLILCSQKDDAVVHYAMGGIQAQVFASRYQTALPSPEVLREEIGSRGWEGAAAWSARA